MSHQSLADQRLEQLKLERTIDSYLTQAAVECPHAVIRYLLNERTNNRHHSERLYTIPIWQIYQREREFIDSLEAIDVRQNAFISSVSHNKDIKYSLCSHLKQ